MRSNCRLLWAAKTSGELIFLTCVQSPERSRSTSGYGNTGACESAITYIDGEKGILRYRGYPIEQLAEHAQFTEVAYLLIHGDLPNRQQYADFRDSLTYHSLIHEDMKKFYEGFPAGAIRWPFFRR